jgi:hypothetical protein
MVVVSTSRLRTLGKKQPTLLLLLLLLLLVT